MEEKKIIVDIQIPDDQVKKATEAISENTKTLEELREANKKLAAEVGKSDKKYIKNAATIKRLSAETRQHERTLIASQKATKANNGSIVALREQLSAATAAYNNLSKEERENTEVGQRLRKQTRDLSDELKRLEGAVGDNRRNVGNYSEGFKQAVAAQNGMIGSSMKLFNVIKANPIMFIVSLLIQFIQKIGATQGAMDALNSVLIPVNTAFQRLIGFFQNLVGEGGLKGFGKALFEWVISPLRGVSKVLIGIVTRDFEKMKDGMNDMTQNFRTVAGVVSDLGKELSEAFEQGQRLAEIGKEIDLLQIELAQNEEALNRAFKEAEERSRNVLLTAEQRKEAAEEAVRIAEQQSEIDKQILELQIEQLEIKLAQNDSDRNAQLELAKLTAQRQKIENDQLDRTRRIREGVIRIEKQQADERRRAAEQVEKERQRQAEQEARDIEKLENDRLRLARETQKQAEQAAKQRLDNELQAAENQLQEQLVLLKQHYLEGEILEQDYQDQLTAIARGGEAMRRGVIASFELTEAEQQIVSLEFATDIQERKEQMLLASEQRILDARIAARDAETEAAKQSAAAEIQLEQQKRDAAIQASQQVLGNLQSNLEEGSAAAKAVAVFQALLNAFASYNAALAQPLPAPVPQILAASNLATGLAQVSKMKQSAPKFADGVIGVEGAGTGTSDSIDAKISRGESVITAKATSAFAPVLAEMERAVGNRPNYNYRKGRFATGVIGGQGLAANFANIGEGQREVEALRNIQIVTRITDIDRVNSRRAIASRVTDIE